MTDAPNALWMRSRAKLNLQLRVTGRRADGYHLLDTLFHALARALATARRPHLDRAGFRR